MTSQHRSTPRHHRSMIALTAAAAVALTTCLAPAAVALTTTDPDGTVTVTADAGTSAPAAQTPVGDPSTTGTTGEPSTSTTADETTTLTETTGEPSTSTTADETVALTETSTITPKACKATVVPAAPWRLVATRDAEEPTIARIEWSGVACATRYNVSVFVEGRDSVDVVPASATTYRLASIDPTKTYRIQVSSRNDAGLGGSSSVFYLRPATPAGITGMKVAYSAIDGATLFWKAPIERKPVTYNLMVTRVADKTVLTEKSISGDLTEFPLATVDARGMYVVMLQPVNKAGDGPKSRLVIGDENPNPVKSVAAIRDPGNPKQVIVSWLASDNTLRGSVLGYEIGYGHSRADERVLVKDTDSEVTVPGDKSVVVIVRVITDRGKSRWSKSVRVPMTDAPKTKTTDQRIDLLDQDGVISVAATQAVADSNRLVVKILPTANNGGFTETQYSQPGAQAMTFRKVPEGSYVVTVENESREMARRYVNVGNVGKMSAADWRLYLGKATIDGDKVDMWNGSETRIFSTRSFATQDMVLASKAQLRSGSGYGVWFRTSGIETNQVTGLSFQYDPKWGNQFIVRQWNKGVECGNPIAKTPFPNGMAINGQHDIVVAAQGNTLYATIDGVRLFDVPDLAGAIANNSCKYPAPTGTAVGLRTWGAGTSAVFTNTTVR